MQLNWCIKHEHLKNVLIKELNSFFKIVPAFSYSLFICINPEFHFLYIKKNMHQFCGIFYLKLRVNIYFSKNGFPKDRVSMQI